MDQIKRQSFEIDRAELLSQSEERFLEMGHMNLSLKRHTKMFEAARAALDAKKDFMSVKGIYRLCGPECFQDGRVRLDGQTISCAGFSQIPGEQIKWICLLLMTAGSWRFSGAAKEQLYLDMWGTAFIDSAREVAEERLREYAGADSFLSPSFGPGYYGMKGELTKAFCCILEADQLGISAGETGILKPEKTVASLYFATKEPFQVASTPCAACGSPGSGCEFCGKKESYFCSKNSIEKMYDVIKTLNFSDSWAHDKIS